MGMFSWICKGCGDELCTPEIVRMNGCVGEYDGYGRAGGFDWSQANGEPVCWHEYCYQNATPEEKADQTPSKPAPNQGFGKPKKKFMSRSSPRPAHPRADVIKPENILKTGPLAGRFAVKGDVIICLNCGKDLTAAAKTLGQPAMVMAHHAYAEAQAHFTSTVEAFHRARNRIGMPDCSVPESRKDMDLQFSVAIGAVNDIIRAIAASNGLLCGDLDPREKKT